MHEALVGHFDVMREHGEAIPEPSGRGSTSSVPRPDSSSNAEAISTEDA